LAETGGGKFLNTDGKGFGMLKRGFDLIVSGVSLLVLLPLMTILAFMIAIKMGRPVLFTQLRPGVNGHPFRIYKLRTMVDRRDGDGELLPDAVRLGRFGRWLRSTSLDELPELWNVLRGDMSLVGPRPLLMAYLPLYNSRQARRHDVRPGLTGWAQINGRNSISWEEKFELDVWYVENQSFWLDMKILLLTLWKVFQREGISANGEVTMSEFRGTENK
jgi:lipopolysaccharide/colanic/teichoic acid biosynthesis glycosyltransferase